MNAWINFAAVGKILLFGLLAGSGVPALFAVGVRLNTAGGPAGTLRVRALTVASWAIFAVVLAVVVFGVLFIARDFIGGHTGVYIFGAKAK